MPRVYVCVLPRPSWCCLTPPPAPAAVPRRAAQIGHHGGDFNNGWFMRPGSSVVEVRMKDFAGAWPDFYFRSLYRTDNVIFYWQAQVVKEGTWAKSAFEEAGELGG